MGEGVSCVGLASLRAMTFDIRFVLTLSSPSSSSSMMIRDFNNG